MKVSMPDPRLQYAEWHRIAGGVVYEMPWNAELFEALAALQLQGVPCCSCQALKGHLSSCQIWIRVEGNVDKPVTAQSFGPQPNELEEAGAMLLAAHNKLTGINTATEEDRNRWAEGRFSDEDKNLLSKDADVFDIMSRTAVPIEIEAACRKELEAAKKRGWRLH